ncbi:branched-chain amino acid transport system II carrier protein [Lachnoanaerobaculum sp. OBRC5-5]|uniref:branched-chain amino acid transport system II carrier protein n=1 Tax=Lachnoanaerobaculum sp. OBRC5-5 TaxID=936595 RepID=UPI0002824663|nr:branched-chain amino acid transport system II carrier protein [Lachnoanaerobaculum sp. OBRC5-5]EJZ71416.1 branched-chain amino acid transport system II carrier protein [Lachnoanaerobaculum sp. OBRC5-5]
MIKKGFLIGLLLFGIFFGAGNLIFPAELGFRAGANFYPAILGFVLSGVGIAIITLVLGTMVKGGYKNEISIKVDQKFATSYLTILYLAIGPFFAIPRTAGTSFSIGIAPVTGNGRLPLLIFSAIYFLFAYLIAINPSKLMDRVGKILTPMFAMLIIILIAVGNMNFHALNQGEMSNAMSALKTGFLEGYNTLDALASVSFCLIATSSIKTFGFSSKKEYIKIMAIVGIVTAIFFSSLYIGLGALGNKFSVPAEVLADPNTNIGTYILSKSSYELFGSFGQVFLGAMTILTCFTTTAGLIVVVSEYFVDTFPRFNYKTYVNIFTFIGFAMSNFGLNTIIKISVPVLRILYPITIVIVAIIILNKFVRLSKSGMAVTVILTTVFSGIEVMGSVLKVKAINTVMSFFIGGDSGFFWINIAVLGIVLSLLLRDKIKGENFEI